MAGYRQSSFDPNAAWGEPGPPLRPYNWVQWTGVGMLVFGAVFFTAYLLGRFGIIPKWIDDGIPFVSFMPLGAALINARRDRVVADPEAFRRRRMSALSVGLAALVLGAAIAIFLKTKGA